MEPAIACIGLGVMGQRMLTNMQTYGGFRLHLGWDPDSEACRRSAETYPGLGIAENAQAAIADPATEVVYIASPPRFHREHALAAMAAGKVVFCEKPLGIDLAESRSLVASVEESGVANAVNFPFAEAAAVGAIERALAAGELGEITGIDIRLHFCKWPRDWQEPAAWLSLREQGGFVRETFSHYAYLTQKLLGPMRLIKAVNRYPADGISAETHSLALFECGGVPVSFAGGIGGPDWNAADRVEFTLWGGKAVYRLSDWNRLHSNEGQGWHERLGDIPDPRQDGYRRMLENLGRFLRGEPNTMPSFREALAVQELVEATLAAGA